jgi:hypothetical protein
MTITSIARHALMSEETSRQNKLWLATSWAHFKGWFIEWKWQGVPMRSRLMFRFGPNEDFVAAKSFEEDVLIKYKFNDERKN